MWLDIIWAVARTHSHQDIAVKTQVEYAMARLAREHVRAGGWPIRPSALGQYADLAETLNELRTSDARRTRRIDKLVCVPAELLTTCDGGVVIGNGSPPGLSLMVGLSE